MSGWVVEWDVKVNVVLVVGRKSYYPLHLDSILNTIKDYGCPFSFEVILSKVYSSIELIPKMTKMKLTFKAICIEHPNIWWEWSMIQISFPLSIHNLEQLLNTLIKT